MGSVYGGRTEYDIAKLTITAEIAIAINECHLDSIIEEGFDIF